MKVVTTSGRDDRSDNFDSTLPFSVTRVHSNCRLIKISRLLVHFLKHSKRSTLVVGSGMLMLYLVPIITLFRRLPAFAIAHGSDINARKFLEKKLITISLSRFKRIISVSRFTASLIDPSLLRNVVVINNGFHPEKFGFSRGAEKSFGSTHPNLITVGTVSERKGQINMVRALPLLVKEYPTIHYHLVGTPLIEDKIISEAKRLNVERNITIHGILSDDVAGRMIQEADIFVMLSQALNTRDVEGFGIAILEANAKSVPAIGSRGCGVEDAIEDGNTGILVDPHSSTEVVNAVKTILADRRRFGDSAKLFSERFTWDQVIQKYISEFC